MGNLSKRKKIIIFSTVLVMVLICAMALMNAFGEDNPSWMLSDGNSATKTDSTSETPESESETKGNADSGMSVGKPESKENADSRMPEGTPETGTGINSDEGQIEPTPAEQDDAGKDQADVRALMEAFGKALQHVSLSAPKDIAAKSIEDNYSGFVTAELLQKWQSDLQSALGRMVSSPWPDRIEVLSIEMTDKDKYMVCGEVIEVTSVELVKGGAAAKRPITIVVEKVNDRYLISALTLGEYIQHGLVVYKNTQYGFCFYLPESWKGYSIIEEQWEGASSGQLVEIGPKLLIRHPGWTQDNPRQDIPIMVFTHEQWDALQNEGFSVGAAPIGPSKLGSNSRYVFALPARYNYAFLTGYEEVEEILKSNPLWPENLSENSAKDGKPHEEGALKREGTPQGENISQGEGIPQGAGIEVRFDTSIEQDGNMFGIEPSGTMTQSPELLEEARRSKEEAERVRTGLFKTEMDIKHEENRMVASIYLYNISQEDMKLDFDLGREFDFIVTDGEGNEVYSRYHGSEYLPAISAISHHRLKAGEKLTFSCTWDYKDNDGNKVAPGRYSLTVKMLPRNYIRNTSPGELTAVKDIDAWFIS